MRLQLLMELVKTNQALLASGIGCIVIGFAASLAGTSPIPCDGTARHLWESTFVNNAPTSRKLFPQSVDVCSVLLVIDRGPTDK
jgi:hypothetical protein